MDADPTTSRTTVEITAECTNSCRICGRAGLEPASGSFDARLASARERTDQVTLTGGEPTLAPGLVDAVRLARSAGFSRIGIQSNGARLDDSLAAELADAGLTDLHLTVHAARPAAHDYITRTPGSHELVCRAMLSARRHELVVAVTSVVTRSTFRELSELPAWLAGRKVAAWCIALPRVAGSLAGAFDALAPRLALSMPYLLHAIAQADGRALPAFIAGAPGCLLGPFATRALATDRLAYGEPCGRCSAEAVCPGVDAAYLARFEADELRPRDAWQRRPNELAGLFVGTGPLRLPTPGQSRAIGEAGRQPSSKVRLGVLD